MKTKLKQRWLRDVLTLPSKVRFAVWKLRNSRGRIKLRLQAGPLFWLEHGSADGHAAYEIWALDMYDPPAEVRAAPIRSVIDLGAQSGHSCLYWSVLFPGARITAFEPHPAHLQSLRENVAENGLSELFEIIPAAAGVAPGDAVLSDEGTSSSIQSDLAKPGIPVPVVDFFARVQSADLVKMDIEGGEYALLSDPRFGTLGARYLILETHEHPDHPDPEAWCREQLARHGYEVIPGAPAKHLWARRTRA